MVKTLIPEDLLVLLREIDTQTVCNAIEVVQGKRGFSRFTRGTMLQSKPGAPAIVGFARTAKIVGLMPPTEPIDGMRTRRLDYFRYMAGWQGLLAAVIDE